MQGPLPQGGPVDPVAIIGMAFRLPGGNDTPSAFWDFIRSAQVAIRDTPADRFDIDAWHSPDPDRSGTTYSRRAGYVGDPYGFDPEFFRISLAEALEMDPQQRWMLQLCWSALEHAGIVPSSLRGQRVGLFLTAGDVDYARRTVASGDPHRITAWGKLGANRAVGVGRVAYTLGLQGPAIFLDLDLLLLARGGASGGAEPALRRLRPGDRRRHQPDPGARGDDRLRPAAGDVADRHLPHLRRPGRRLYPRRGRRRGRAEAGRRGDGRQGPDRGAAGRIGREQRRRQQRPDGPERRGAGGRDPPGAGPGRRRPGGCRLCRGPRHRHAAGRPDRAYGPAQRLHAAAWRGGRRCCWAG